MCIRDRDIIAELLRPGRDMRDELPAPMLRSDVMSLEDLKPGMELMGTVRNVIDLSLIHILLPSKTSSFMGRPPKNVC